MAVWGINSCRNVADYYSCSVDTICDIFFYAIFPFLSLCETECILSLGDVLLSQLINLSNIRRPITDRVNWSKSRETVWQWLVLKLPRDFAPKGRIDACLDNAFLSFGQSDMFCSNSVLTCAICRRCIARSVSAVGLNSYSINECGGNLEQSVNNHFVKSRLCCTTPMNVVVTKLPKFMLIMLPVTSNYQQSMYAKLNIAPLITVSSKIYKLTGAVRATGSHFIPFVATNNLFCEMDDLKARAKCSQSFAKCVSSTVYCRRMCCSGDNICDRQKIWLLVYAETDRDIQLLDENTNRVGNWQMRNDLEIETDTKLTAQIRQTYGKAQIKTDIVDSSKLTWINNSDNESERKRKARQSMKSNADEYIKFQLVESKRQKVKREKANIQADSTQKRNQRERLKQNPDKYANYLKSESDRMRNKRDLTKAELSDSDAVEMSNMYTVLAVSSNSETKRQKVERSTDTIDKPFEPAKKAQEKLRKKVGTNQIISTNDAVATKQNIVDGRKAGKNKLETAESQFDRNVSVDSCGYCAICTKLLFSEHIRKFCGNFERCSMLKKSVSPHTLCAICLSHVKANKHPPLCYENNLDPGNCRLLTKLSYLEQRWVNLINVFMTVTNLPGGQYCQEGQAIHFVNNIDELHTKLPTVIDDTGMVVLDKVGNVTIDSSKIIRSQLISRCIWWLKTHNLLFKDVVIPMQYWIPKDCQSTGNKEIYEFVPPVEISLIAEDYTPPTLDSIRERLRETNVTEIKTLKLERCEGGLVNIFKDAQLEEKSFVKLFPFGKNGFSQKRDDKLTIHSYLKSRLEGKDSRFRSNISYLFWALNVFEQNKIQEQISIALKTTAANEGCRNKIVDNILNDSSYTFVKNIRGTVGYWKNVLVDLLAKIKTIGAPTWFVTLSADDNHWPDVQKLCNLDEQFTSATEALRQNPVLASKQFRRRWIEIFRWLKTSKALGTITDHFERVEFQNRGSPHLHIFIWVENSPDLKTDEGKKQFPHFVDKYISTTIPADEYLKSLVLKYQMHKHTDSCKAKIGKNKCRFNYPRPQCEETKLIQNMNYTTSRKFYETKRNVDEKFVNSYNVLLLEKWKANIDVQFVGNAYGVAAYVCDYICKSEPKKLKESIKQTISEIKSSKELSARQILSKFGHVFLSNRCIGAYEAAFRLLGIPLVNSTRATIYVNCRERANRYRMVKKEFLKNDISLYTPDEICHLGLIDYYIRRPKSSKFDDLTLLEFASKYSVVSKCPGQNSYNSYYKLQNCEMYIRERKNAACVRTNQPCFQSDRENHYLRLLMLHFPFRNENELKSNLASYQESFSTKSEAIRKKVIEQDKFAEELDKAIQQLRIIESDNTSDLVSHLVKSVDQHDNVVSNISENVHDDVTSNAKSNLQTDMKHNSGTVKRLECYTMTDNDFAVHLNGLNTEQRCIVDEIKSKVEKQLKSHTESSRIHMFVSGQAGTGKSYLIATLYELLIRLYNTDGSSVLKSAPTGVASCNIDGATLHRTLMLPVTKYQYQYAPLDPCRLHEARQFFKKVQFIVIDEISMVSYRMLTFIHKRLCELKCNDSLFGGLNILALGDFYQLRPVADRFIFAEATDLQHLWNDVVSVKQLTLNMRQKFDPSFASILDSIRVGKPLTPDMIKILKYRVSAHLLEPEFTNCLWIFALRDNVNSFNTKQLNEIESKTNQTAIVISSEDEQSNRSTSYSNGSDEIPFSELDATGLSTTIQLIKEARVMLVRNLSVADKLVNGSVGTVIDFIFGDTDKTYVKHVVVQFDHIKGPIEIEKLSTSIFTKNRAIWKRTQFPLQLCFAATIHKVQGLTLPKVVVDCGPTIFEAAMAYVAISRVKTLKDISFTNFCEKSLRAFQTVTEYYSRVLSENKV